MNLFCTWNKETATKVCSRVPAMVWISIAYGFFALIFALGNRHQINPDGVAYLRLAKYCSEGHFFYSISSYWSPLIIWCFAPFLFLGMDGLLTSRIIIAVWGLFFLWGVWLLSSRFFLSYPFKILAGLIAALMIAQWTSQVISPDILIAACLTFYFYLVTDEKLVESKQKAFLCGVVASVAFLAKAYALPFFLIHFPVTVYIRKLTTGRNIRFPYGKMAKILCCGMIGFFLLSAAWIGLMTEKNQKLTISLSGKANHAIMSPKDINRYHPTMVGLHKPRPYAIASWEDPSSDEYKDWSPFQSFKYFKHQIKVCLRNAVTIASFFGISGGLILVLLPFLFFNSRLKPEKAFLYLWAFATVIVYMSGYLFVYSSEQRYYWPILAIIPLLAFQLLSECNMSARQLSNLFIILAIVLSFSAHPIKALLRASYTALFVKQINVPYEIARRLGTDIGSFAVVGARHVGIYIGYYLNKQFYGHPLSSEPEGAAEEMRAAKITTLLMSSESNEMLLKKFLESDRFEHSLHIPGASIGNNRDVDVFSLKEDRLSAPAT